MNRDKIREAFAEVIERESEFYVGYDVLISSLADNLMAVFEDDIIFPEIPLGSVRFHAGFNFAAHKTSDNANAQFYTPVVRLINIAAILDTDHGFFYGNPGETAFYPAKALFKTIPEAQAQAERLIEAEKERRAKLEREDP